MDALVDGGFGLDQEQFKALMSEYAGTIADKVDVILFAQDPWPTVRSIFMKSMVK